MSAQTTTLLRLKPADLIDMNVREHLASRGLAEVVESITFWEFRDGFLLYNVTLKNGALTFELREEDWEKA